MRGPFGQFGSGLVGSAEHVGAFLLYPLLRERWEGWGAAQPELERTGRLLGPDPMLRHVSTRAVDIHAPPSAIWPWLLQIGQNRGGFFSFTALENLVGCHMPELRKLEPRLQIRGLGDLVYYHPKAKPDTVTRFEPERVLRIGRGWEFELCPDGQRRTRLLVRTYSPAGDSLKHRLAWRGLFDPIHFVMERRMMLQIKRFAEATARGEEP